MTGARRSGSPARSSECSTGEPLIDTILKDVHQELGGHLQPDDLTLLTANVVGQVNR